MAVLAGNFVSDTAASTPDPALSIFRMTARLQVMMLSIPGLNPS
jgi:hypothetical protein